MARVKVDGKPINITSTSDVVGADDKQVTIGLKDGTYRIVPAYQARSMPAELIDTLEKNQTQIDQGASDFATRKKYLDLELPHISAFLDTFEFNTPGIEPVVNINGEYSMLGIENFPLPDNYSPDYENIGIYIPDYPAIPPVGIYVKDGSPNIDIIREKMMGRHVFNRESYQNFDYVYDAKGWTWICFHYANLAWNFNFSDFRSGDNLTKYIKAVYSNLCGNFEG